MNYKRKKVYFIIIKKENRKILTREGKKFWLKKKMRILWFYIMF